MKLLSKLCQGRSFNVENITKMVEIVRESCPRLKVSIEVEKPRPVLTRLIPLADLTFISREFAEFSGYSSMEESVKGFSKSAKIGYAN